MASPSSTFNAAAASPGFSLHKSGNQQQMGSLKIGSSRVKFAKKDESHLLKFGLTRACCSMRISTRRVGEGRDPDAWRSDRIVLHPERRKPSSLSEPSKESCRLGDLKDHKKHMLDEKECGQDPLEDLKHRFLSFKRKHFLENRIHYENLSEGQAPKFMVIACTDSRVCPSRVLGFQPGEAFTVRNVANLVPPFQHGTSETSAALEFAVNSLEVVNVLVVGHSRCGGIQALMSMKDESDSRSFIRDWVSIAKSARLSTKAAAGNLSFEKQCTHCEKESINSSLLNLLSYPWIEKRVSEGTLSVHGGYYDFVNCSFEKWTLVYREGLEGGSKYAIKNRSFWS